MPELKWVEIPVPQEYVWYEQALQMSDALFRELTRPGFAFTPAPDPDPVEAYFAADLIAAE